MTDLPIPQPKRKNPSYYREEPLVVTEKMRRQIRGAFAEIDMAQIKILKQMTPVQRFQQARAMNYAVNRSAVFQLRKREPRLSEDEAWRIVNSGKVVQRALEKSKEKDGKHPK